MRLKGFWTCLKSGKQLLEIMTTRQTSKLQMSLSFSTVYQDLLIWTEVEQKITHMQNPNDR